MTNLTMENFLEANDESKTPEPVPFLGFMTGGMLSAALWASIGLAVWVVG